MSCLVLKCVYFAISSIFFILPDFISTTPEWRHISISYNNQNQQWILYTDGVQINQTNIAYIPITSQIIPKSRLEDAIRTIQVPNIVNVCKTLYRQPPSYQIEIKKSPIPQADKEVCGADSQVPIYIPEQEEILEDILVQKQKFITIYEHCDYKGQTLRLPVGEHRLSQWWLEHISAIIPEANMRYTIIKDIPIWNFMIIAKKVFTTEVPCLLEYGFNDFVSKIIVEDLKPEMIYQGQRRTGRYRNTGRQVISHYESRRNCSMVKQPDIIPPVEYQNVTPPPEPYTHCADEQQGTKPQQESYKKTIYYTEKPPIDKQTLRIGAGNNEGSADNFLANGSLIDDFQFFNRTLTNDEISELYMGYKLPKGSSQPPSTDCDPNDKKTIS